MGKEAVGCSLLSIMLCAALPAYGDYEVDELPVVLSASRLRQPIKDAPAAVTVIDREMIKASGSRSLPDLLRLVPGFLVGQLNGSSASVTNQGLADAYSRQMQVLIDGRSIYSPLYGGVNWADIPLATVDIERIEVVRGPNAVAFGANSFLGVINIITREPGTDQGNHVEWVRGNAGVDELTYRHGGVERDWRYRVTAVRNEDHGFSGIFDSQKSDKVNFRGEYQIDPANQLQTQLGYVGGIRGQSDGGTRLRGVDSAFVQLRWTQRNSADDEWWIQYFHDQRSASEKLIYPLGAPYGDLLIDFGMDTQRDDIELQRNLTVGQSLRMSWGGQVRHDAARSSGLLGTNAWFSNNLMRLFGNFEWRVQPDVVLNAGIMFERTSLTSSSFSPRIAMNWEVVPLNTVRLSWGQAERTPTLFESRGNSGYRLKDGTLLRQNFYVPVVPSAEKNETVELGYVGEYPFLSLSSEFRFFGSRLTGLLATSAVPYSGQFPYFASKCESAGLPSYQCAQTFTNQDRLNISGIDFTFRWIPIEGTKIYYAGASLLSGSSSINQKSLIAQTPSTTESILLDQRLFDQWQLSVGLYTIGGMKWAGGEQQTGYHKADIRLARSFSPAPGYKGELAWVVENASQPTMDYYGYVKPPRVSTLRLSMDF